MKLYFSPTPAPSPRISCCANWRCRSTGAGRYQAKTPADGEDSCRSNPGLRRGAETGQRQVLTEASATCHTWLT